MKKTTKVALLSAFVFPGCGHYVLKKYIHSLVIASAAFYGVYIISTKLYSRAEIISEKILSGEIAANVEAITAALANQPIAEVQQINTATTVIIIAWLVGIIDSYRIAFIENKKQQQHDSLIKQENNNED
jgi:hypothetical protein